MTAYSTAVGPLSSRTKQRILRTKFNNIFDLRLTERDVTPGKKNFQRGHGKSLPKGYPASGTDDPVNAGLWRAFWSTAIDYAESGGFPANTATVAMTRFGSGICNKWGLAGLLPEGQAPRGSRTAGSCPTGLGSSPGASRQEGVCGYFGGRGVRTIGGRPGKEPRVFVLTRHSLGRFGMPVPFQSPANFVFQMFEDRILVGFVQDPAHDRLGGFGAP